MSADATSQRKKLFCEVIHTAEEAERIAQQSANVALQQEQRKATQQAFYCSTCDKQYKNVKEMEHHYSSYDHHHRKRQQDLRQQQLQRKRWQQQTSNAPQQQQQLISREQKLLQKRIQAAQAAQEQQQMAIKRYRMCAG